MPQKSGIAVMKINTTCHFSRLAVRQHAIMAYTYTYNRFSLIGGLMSLADYPNQCAAFLSTHAQNLRRVNSLNEHSLTLTHQY
jgi:hypothetical protein